MPPSVSKTFLPYISVITILIFSLLFDSIFNVNSLSVGLGNAFIFKAPGTVFKFDSLLVVPEFSADNDAQFAGPTIIPFNVPLQPLASCTQPLYVPWGRF